MNSTRRNSISKEFSGGINPGMEILIEGSIHTGCKNIDINLICSYDDDQQLEGDRDIALQIKMDLDAQKVICNSQEQGTIIKDSFQKCNYQLNNLSAFTIMIVVELSKYNIIINGQNLFSFKHRIPFTKVNKLDIDGAVEIKRVEYINMNCFLNDYGCLSDKLVKCEINYPTGLDFDSHNDHASTNGFPTIAAYPPSPITTSYMQDAIIEECQNDSYLHVNLHDTIFTNRKS